MNFSKLYKVFDTVASVIDSTREQPRKDQPQNGSQPAPPSFADQVEMRLTNVVVAALKEAFDRDHTRLELERTRLEEERRRAEETTRLELQRQAAEREIGRLRLLAGAAIVGWIASVALLLVRLQQMSNGSRGVLIAAAGLLLASLGSGFYAQAGVAASAHQKDPQSKPAAGDASLWLLLAGLALAAASLLF